MKGGCREGPLEQTQQLKNHLLGRKRRRRWSKRRRCGKRPRRRKNDRGRKEEEKEEKEGQRQEEEGQRQEEEGQKKEKGGICPSEIAFKAIPQCSALLYSFKLYL